MTSMEVAATVALGINVLCLIVVMFGPRSDRDR